MKKIAILAIFAGTWFAHTAFLAPQGGTPEKAVKNFLTAISKGDFDKAKKYGDDNTDKLMDLLKMMKDQMPKPDSKTAAKIKTVECVLDGDKGTCSACCNTEGEPLDGITVQKVNGQWLVVMDKENMKKEEPIEEPGGENEED